MTQPLSFRYAIRAYEPGTYGLPTAPRVTVDDFNSTDNLWDVVERVCSKVTAYKPLLDLNSTIVIETDNPDWGAPTPTNADSYIPQTLHHRYPRAIP